MVWGFQRDTTRIFRALVIPSRREQKTSVKAGVLIPPLVRTKLVQARLSPRWLAQVWGLVLGIAAVLAWMQMLITAAVVFALGTFVIFWYVRYRARAEAMTIERDLPALLTAIASSVRAGVDPLAALVGAREYLPRETALARELERIQQGLREGRDEQELLEGFLASYSSRDGELLRGCMILSRKHGGPLADSLHRITRVVRQRQSFRRKTRAALAMHRMSAVGIALSAVAMGTLQLAMNHQSLDVALHHPVGGKVVVGGMFFITVGVVWMLRMGSEASVQ